MSNENTELCASCGDELEEEGYPIINDKSYCECCGKDVEQDIIWEYSDKIVELMIDYTRENYGKFAKEIEDMQDVLNQLEDEYELQEEILSIFKDEFNSSSFFRYLTENTELSTQYIIILMDNVYVDEGYDKYIHEAIEEYNELINAPVLK
tara:strand:+ start:110 stop:562 length:453 start_codon:yes stop_codon:yes gene_type:complete